MTGGYAALSSRSTAGEGLLLLGGRLPQKQLPQVRYLRWSYVPGGSGANRAKTLSVEPGSPWENGYIESFNGRFRQECLNENWFLSLEDAREKIAIWREHYNGDRPHDGALGNLAPLEFAAAEKAAKLTLQLVQ